MTIERVDDDADVCAFIVGLYRSKSDDLRVRSVEIVNGDMRNRYSFRDGRSLPDIFAPDFATSILNAVAGLGRDKAVLSRPDYIYSASGLEISGLRVLSSGPDDGPEAIILRFQRYVGGIKQVLRFETSMALPPATVRERIAVDVLSDIITPVFDMLALSHSTSREMLAAHGDAIGNRLDRLATQEEEIKFFAGLLQRYIAGCQKDAASLDAAVSDEAALRREG